MKLKSVSILGMHKVAKQVYEFNDDITYFIGPNGVGKSTILEAVQLALFGYIPGYPKKNDSIMKHASDNIMSVTLELEEDISITRTWVKTGSSIKATLDTFGIEPDEKTIAELFSGIELPVFNFNEFKSMTANKLKDWFITFLPPATDTIDFEKELTDAIGDRQLPIDKLLPETLDWIKASNLEGVELVRALNSKFKSDQSFVKGQIESAQNTIQSLIKYDDAEDIDEESIKEEIEDLNDLKSALMQYQANQDVYDKVKVSYESLKSTLPAEDYASDPRVIPINEELDGINKQLDILRADNADLVSRIRELQQEKMMLPKASSTCPYTNKPCNEAAALVSQTQEKIAAIDAQIQSKREELEDCSDAKIQALNQKAAGLKGQLFLFQSQYDKLTSVKLQLEGAECNTIECPTDKNMLQIDAEIRELETKIIQSQANKRYDELCTKVQNESFKFQNELEIYKLWAKLTDANGLQTRIMDKPFLDLAADMSKYLTQMFGSDTTAKFNLIAKANSFSFGLERDGKYIEFDCLSSGEKCLFTLALILCILDKSASQIRTLLIDDILDHLDESNANYLFDALKGVPDVQFILAGVKQCNDSTICKEVQ